MHTQLRTAQIELLQDHESHGLFNLPCQGLDISRFLYHTIVELQTHSADVDMMSKLGPHLMSHQSADATEVHLLSFKVFCKDNDWLVPDMKLVWKWVKPQSVYRTSGFWETTLEKVFVDAEWSAGTGISIVVKSVDDDEYLKIEKGRVK